MPSRNTWVLVLIAVFVLVSGVASAVTDDLSTQLTWPRSFVLDSGESASFGFPVTEVGNISAQASWTGGVLKVSLLGPDGKPVWTSASQSSPVQISYTVTAADLQKGTIWLVAFTAPSSPSGKSVARGRLNVSYPPFDAAKVNAFIASTTAKIKELANRFASVPVTGGVSDSVQAENTRMKQNVKIEALLTREVASATEKVKAERLASVKSIRAQAHVSTSMTTHLPGYKPTDTPMRPVQITDPTVTELIPDQGFTGDKIVVKTLNFKPDITANQAVFYVEDDSKSSPTGCELNAAILSAVQNGNGVDFTIAVPPLPVGFTHTDRSWVKIIAQTPYFCAFGPDFTWTSVPMASIKSFTPSIARSGDYLDLTGYNFTSKTKIRFGLPDGTDAEAKSTLLVNSTTMRAQVPYYSSKKDSNGSVYAQTTAPNGAVINDKRILFILTPTIPTITGLDRTSANPGQSILVHGIGFDAYSQVTFKTSGGRQYQAYPTSSNDTTLLVKVPDIELVPMGGIDVDVIVKTTNMGASDPVQLHVDPIIDYVEIRDPSKLELVKFACDVSWDGWGCAYQIRNPAMVKTNVDAFGMIYGMHASNQIGGHKADDQWALANMNLRNGWKFSHVTLKVYPYEDQARQRRDDDPFNVTLTSVGTDDKGRTIATLHTWVTPSLNGACYGLSFWIEGPKGFPYQ